MTNKNYEIIEIIKQRIVNVIEDIEEYSRKLNLEESKNGKDKL